MTDTWAEQEARRMSWPMFRDTASTADVGCLPALGFRSGEATRGRIWIAKGVLHFPANARMARTGEGRRIPHAERLVYAQSVFRAEW